MVLRTCQTLLVAALAFHLALIVFNNLTDYGSNFQFVAHVLSMDTTFEGNRGLWRAWAHPLIHHTVYGVLIAWEALAAGLCGAGALRLWRRRHTSAQEFRQAKDLATMGLTVALLLWLVAFLSVGGEWFLMWQSRIWNGQTAASRLFAITGIVLLILRLRDED